MMDMDAVDTQILTELIKDAQMPFSKISQKIGVSRETVRKRFEKMKKDGIIDRITILIDGRKIGEQGTAFLMLTCLRGADKKAVFQKLQIVPDVCMVTELMGNYDFFVWARIRNMQQIAQIISEIRKCDGIDNIETLLLPQTYFGFSLIPKITIKCDGLDLLQKKLSTS
jgi:DNA-binding Lrp family transcriptional regulator